MRILLSCLQALQRHDMPACDFWRTYFSAGAKEAGCEILEVPGVDWAAGISGLSGDKQREWRARTWEKTLRFAREQQEAGGVDLFLGYLYPQQVEPDAIKALQGLGVPCVNFFCDNVREFRRVPGEYRDFDLHWVPEFEAIPLYRAAGLAHLHAAMPCWVPPQLRSVPKAETEPATFLGSADALRRQLLGDAVQRGAPLTIRGPGWLGGDVPGPKKDGGNFLANQAALVRRHGWAALGAKIVDRLAPPVAPAIPASCFAPPVFGDEYFRVTREALVTVGINRVPVSRRPLRQPLKYSRLRDIEAPMLGACYLTEHCEGVARLYDIGREVETYTDAAEFAGKLEMLAADAERRRNLRARAQKRALNEHSVAATLRAIMARLGLKQPVSVHQA